MEETPMKVEIVNTVRGQHGTTLLIDGVEVPELRSVTLEHKTGQRARITAEVTVMRDFKLNFDSALVFIEAYVPAGCRMRSRSEEDGSTTIWSEESED